MKCHGIVASIALLFAPLAACNSGPLSVGRDDDGGNAAKDAGRDAKRSDGCAAENVCLSTVSCTDNRECAALGSACDPCTKLCGCGVMDASKDGTNPGDGGTDAVGGSCVTDADCGPGDICGFEASLACTAQGRCFPVPQTSCNAVVAGCACDGTEINLACNGLPSGYETKPLAHAGACEGGADAGEGGMDSGVCSTTADCAPDELCGFETSLGCTAHGQCLPMMQDSCNVVVTACACDGTEINIACGSNLPTGYGTKPVAYVGACQDGGVEADASAEGGVGTCMPTTCAPSDICIQSQILGGFVFHIDDAGTCPASMEPDSVLAGFCMRDPTTACAPRPASCGSAITCACAGTLCGSEQSFMCVDAPNASFLSCVFDAP